MPNLRNKTWTSTTPANTSDAQFWEDHLIDDDVAAQIKKNTTAINDEISRAKEQEKALSDSIKNAGTGEGGDSVGLSVVNGMIQQTITTAE